MVTSFFINRISVLMYAYAQTITNRIKEQNDPIDVCTVALFASNFQENYSPN